MNATQLTLFEPSGAELASLARTHADTARALQVKADNLKLRGFLSSCRVFLRMADQSDEQATVCEIALQFEELAGLV